MRLPVSKFYLFVLFGFVLCSCTPPEKMPIQTQTALTLKNTAIPSTLLPEQKKQILLVSNSESPTYYISDFSGKEMTQLKLPDEIESIAMSPNGRIVAYVPVPANSEDRATIYLLDINSNKTIKLQKPDAITILAGLLIWSPDNKEIAFSCWAQETQGLSLCSANVTTQTIKVLMKSDVLQVSNDQDGARPSAWSKDGKTIAFQSSRSPSALVAGVKTQIPVDLWQFDLTNQQAKRIFVSDTAGIGLVMQPVFLADENAILFSGRKETFNTIFKYNLDTQEIKDITASGNHYDMTNILLSPDSKTFLTIIPFGDDGSNYVPVLYSVNGELIKQLDALKNMQVISWGEQ